VGVRQEGGDDDKGYALDESIFPLLDAMMWQLQTGQRGIRKISTLSR
jgi:hypothetical protein